MSTSSDEQEEAEVRMRKLDSLPIFPNLEMCSVGSPISCAVWVVQFVHTVQMGQKASHGPIP